MTHRDIRFSVDEIEATMWQEMETAYAESREPARAWRPLRCVECGDTCEVGSGWVAYFLSFGAAETAVYCPICSRREFGSA